MYKLYILESINDPLVSLVNDDPVRPDIPLEFRIDPGRATVFVLQDLVSSKPIAVVCTVFMDCIPSSVDQLLSKGGSNLDTVVFYTIWSYVSGGGATLLSEVSKWLVEHQPHITNFVTLSPCTDLARRFHLRNGAIEYRVNSDSINYLYR